MSTAPGPSSQAASTRLTQTSSHGPALEDASIEAVYSYRNERNVEVFQVVRKVGKKFQQRHDDGHGRWIWKMEGVQRVPFRLPQLLAADVSTPVYILEGEKDVETAVKLGLVATCNPGGAGKWSAVAETANEAISGHDVIIIGGDGSQGP